MIRLFTGRRRTWVYLVLLIVAFVYLSKWHIEAYPRPDITAPQPGASKDATVETDDDPSFVWRTLPIHYPPESLTPIPAGSPLALPKLQAVFPRESPDERDARVERQQAVKKAFLRCWDAYKAHAWMSDEVAPISGSPRNTFGGWGATLIDSLDTLWIMGLQHEFELAVSAAVNISFETTPMDEINVFETNIRYLGGFLSAFDLSGDKRLLRKAKEVGDMLYVAFDTPNRMPITRWHLHEAARGDTQIAQDNVLLAEMGSFTMEFTRLSIITGDPKWFDAAQRITDVFKKQQDRTRLPGMWPIVVNGRDQAFNSHNAFTLGAMADSMFEYLPKTYALSGGLLPVYRGMYEKAMGAAIKHNLFRPMIPDEQDILIPGLVNIHLQDGKAAVELDPEGQHLACYVGGMLALGGKIFNIPEHLEKAEKLVDGCVWTYQALPLGVMPESFHMHPCQSTTSCKWDEAIWKKEVLRKHKMEVDDLTEADTVIEEMNLPKGFTRIGDRRYILRPEAIESVFVLYRITGRKDLLDTAWAMFEAIDEHTRTELANSALSDVTVTNGKPPHSDSMESFWMGETLKYFYLIFSEPDLVSLDEYVFNTEAHPFKRLAR